MGTVVLALVGLGVLAALYLRRQGEGAPAEESPIFGGKEARSDSPDSPGSQYGAAPFSSAARAGKAGGVEHLRTTTFLRARARASAMDVGDRRGTPGRQ